MSQSPKKFDTKKVQESVKKANRTDPKKFESNVETVVVSSTGASVTLKKSVTKMKSLNKNRAQLQYYNSDVNED